MSRIKIFFIFCFLFFSFILSAQPPMGLHWAKDGNAYYESGSDGIIKKSLPSFSVTVIASKAQLTPADSASALPVRNFFFSNDGSKILIYTNSKRVWRQDTRGDYWVLNLKTNSLKKLGKNLPVSSLMFAKFSPDAGKVAYVSGHNIYVENLNTGSIKQLTKDGETYIINGTFDWAYEEEFFCRDGFRWSPDGNQIAYWQIDARGTKDYLMLDNTDSLYPFIKPVEYPVAGEPPSLYKIGVVNISTAQTRWMSIPTDPVLRSYVPRMEWADNNTQLIIQHLNRYQNQSDLMLCDVETGKSNTIYEEKDSAWIDILPLWDEAYSYGGWDWLDNGKEFLWGSEKDGWRHLYLVSRDGKKETLITKGNYDVMYISSVDEKSGYVYFLASPYNATQKYLYRTKLDGSKTAEEVTPAGEPGTHDYDISPTGEYAFHSFSNYYTPHVKEWVELPSHKALGEETVKNTLAKSNPSLSNIHFFKIKTADSVEMDAWMAMPDNFDSTKKYPVVFFVYTEPWGQNVKDQFGVSRNGLYTGNMAKDGYIYISIDNRGTPVPKGREWRKSIYKNLGVINIRDQAMAAKEILKWPFVDTSRIAVWGWSGGGTATLNLMFQYPDIYKTGIAIAAVGDAHTYDNIYQERYLGLPQLDNEAYIQASPITFAKNLQGNLLYIHGTGDDNVHYKNAEELINVLVKYNKQFQMMSYPNRTHGISEGEGTSLHLRTLYTDYLRAHCPPGGR